ncbi:hypothetical protein D3C79_878960 [compost metagenome]
MAKRQPLVAVAEHLQFTPAQVAHAGAAQFQLPMAHLAALAQFAAHLIAGRPVLLDGETGLQFAGAEQAKAVLLQVVLHRQTLAQDLAGDHRQHCGNGQGNGHFQQGETTLLAFHGTAAVCRRPSRRQAQC